MLRHYWFLITLGIGVIFLGATTGITGVPPISVGSEFAINQSGVGNQMVSAYRAVAADALGEFVNVWSQNFQNIRGQRFDANGTPMGVEFPVESALLDQQFYHAIGMNQSGYSVVTWVSFKIDWGRKFLRGQRFDPRGGYTGLEFDIAQFDSDNNYATTVPTVKVDKDNNFVVVWQDTPPHGAPMVYFRRYDWMAMAYGDPVQVNGLDGDSHAGADLGVKPDGDFVVVWTKDGAFTGEGKVLASLYSKCGTYKTTVTVAALTPEQISFGTAGASIAMNDSGSFVVSWAGPGGTRLARVYAPDGNPLTGEITLATSVVTAPYLTNGLYFLEVGHGDDGDGDGIFAQWHSPDGSVFGNLTQVNSYTTGNQQYPSLASLGSGRYVVTWNSDGQDGDAGGIYGAILSGAPPP